MSNVCITSWSLKGSPEAIDKLVSILEKAKPESRHNRPWLPYVVEAAGGTLPDNTDGRSEFVHWKACGDTLELTTEDAYVPKTDLMGIIAKACGFTKTLYLAEGFEDDVFETNDREGKRFTTKYALDLDTDVNRDIEALTYFDSDEELLAFIKEKLGLDYDTAQEARDNIDDDLYDLDEDAFVSLHAIEYTDELR